MVSAENIQIILYRLNLNGALGENGRVKCNYTIIPQIKRTRKIAQIR